MRYVVMHRCVQPGEAQVAGRCSRQGAKGYAIRQNSDAERHILRPRSESDGCVGRETQRAGRISDDGRATAEAGRAFGSESALGEKCRICFKVLR